MARIDAAVQNPSRHTLARRTNSVRRTSNMDINFLADGRLELVGAARDLWTRSNGEPEVLGVGQVRALVGPTRLLERLDTTPVVQADGLLGTSVSRGFRAGVDRAVPHHRDLHSPLYLLLDELPVAALISGYAMLYARNDGPLVADGPSADQETPRRGPASDICSGWRSEGLMMQAIAAGEGIPTPIGPVAPRLEATDDPLAWHDVPALAAESMRRRRLIDVAGLGESVLVSAMFRDTHVDPDGIETVLHEYSLEMEVDAVTMIVRRCHATPRTLPWPECPAAAASAGRLAGHSVSDLRALVRTDFHGTSTCTHLNDLLRSLADVGVLTESLEHDPIARS
jgi:hypothetical protein